MRRPADLLEEKWRKLTQNFWWRRIMRGRDSWLFLVERIGSIFWWNEGEMGEEE